MTSMNKPVLLPAMAGLLALASVGTALAQDEQGRVISSTPVVQAIAVPRQVCQEQVVTVPGHRSGAGALVGGIAGGAIGHAVGDGSGRALATVIGVVGGALLGDRLEGGGQTRTQTVQPCNTQNFYENRTVAYNVVYEYAGRQYTTQMPQDPGRFVRLSVTPVDNLPPAPPARYGRQPDAHEQRAAPVLIRSSVGTQFYPAYPLAPRVVYINGYRHAPVQQFHPQRDRRDWHDRHEHRRDHRRDRQEDRQENRQENRWERDGR
jgi:uncharacterized protein YcfJ